MAPERTWSELMADGEAELAANRDRDAASTVRLALTRAETEFGENSEEVFKSLRLLSQVHERLGEFNQGAQHLRRALENCEARACYRFDETEALMDLARIMVKLGDLAGAATATRRASDLSPESRKWEPIRNLAAHYVQQEQEEAAHQLLQEAIREGSLGDASLAQLLLTDGLVLARMGDLERARTQFDAALDVHRKHPDDHAHGYAHSDALGRYAEVLRGFGKEDEAKALDWQAWEIREKLRANPLSPVISSGRSADSE
jgi:tetratricopeptide (TPR) repeat protein